ncbi:MAG: DUF2157 domain-containing protein [Oxalobacteraceae bacterium]|nr:MAG: DUF2157 domain-containing protein [Oxalobacteraceae bacterium]
MTTRLALLDLIARTTMDAKQASRLWRLAGFEGMPPRALERIPLGLTIAGAGCAGLGLIFWVAANWALLSRFQQFSLLQLLVLAPCIWLATYARGRAAIGLLVLVAIGGLFAYFGQTYQMGADPWQLFAVWAALALPLACCARTDTVWAAWALVALVGIALWERAHTGSDAVTIIAALGAAGLTLALRTFGRRYLGVGDWAYRVALVLTASWVTTLALLSLDSWVPAHAHYWFSVILASAAGALLAYTKPFDIFPASVVALCLNVLLVGGLVNLLLKGFNDNTWIGSLLVVGLSAAGLLAGSVKLILWLARAVTLPKKQEEQA